VSSQRIGVTLSVTLRDTAFVSKETHINGHFGSI